MKDLIERLEQATGPDRHLDFAIHDALFPPKRKHVADVELPPGFGDDAFSHAMDPRPCYTASIDAALSLVPEGWDVWLGLFSDERPNAAVSWKGAGGYATPDKEFDETAATPAIALCIAALRARLTVVSGGRDG